MMMKHVLSGHSCFVSGKVRESVAHYSLAVQGAAPDDVNRCALYCNLAMCRVRMKAMDLARGDINSALAINPHYGPALLLQFQMLKAEAATSTAVDDFLRTTVPADVESFVSLVQGAGRPTPPIPPQEAQAMINHANSLMQSKKIAEADSIFSQLIDRGWDRAAAPNVGRGTARALLGRFDDALVDLRRALEIDAKDPDVHRRLAQVWSAKNNAPAALAHLIEAVRLDPLHVESVALTAQLQTKLLLFDEAMVTLDNGLRLHGDLLELHQLRVKCLSARGDHDGAGQAATEALRRHPSDAALHTLLGTALHSRGLTSDAIVAFQRAVALKPDSDVHYLCAFAYFAEGNTRGCVEWCQRAIDVHPMAKEAHYLLAVAFCNTGQYSKCIATCETIRITWPQHTAAFIGLCATFLQCRLDEDFRTRDANAEMSPHLKEAMCKRISATDVLRKVIASHGKEKEKDNNNAQDVDGSVMPSGKETALFRAADRIGSLLQLKCKGFAANRRMHRMAGLAVMEMSQAFFRNDAQGGWREWMHVGVRWRSLVDCLEPVFWLDQLPSQMFEEGYGLHTPVLHFSQRVCKYNSYAERLLGRAKALVPEQYVLTVDMTHAVEAATSVEDLCAALGQHVMVIVPVVGPRGERLEGTRITAVVEGAGTSFGIRMPSTPPRHFAFDPVMQHLFLECKNNWSDRAVASFYHYWVNFQPVTRGSAAMGLIAVLALYHTKGMGFRDLTVADTQPDWESLLAENGDGFIDGFASHLHSLSAKEESICLPDVRSVLPTYRKAVWALEVHV